MFTVTVQFKCTCVQTISLLYSLVQLGPQPQVQCGWILRMKLNKDQVLPRAEERTTVSELSTITEEDQESRLEQNQSSDVRGKYKGIIRGIEQEVRN